MKIQNEERIVRGVYHQMNFNNKGELKDNVLRSPSNKDEISVIRLDHCDIEFCRSHFKTNEKPEINRKYWGFFLLIVAEVRNAGSEVISTQDHFEQHADIKHGYVVLPNIELPLEIRIKINALMYLAKQRLKQDQNPEIEWTRPLM